MRGMGLVALATNVIQCLASFGTQRGKLQGAISKVQILKRILPFPLPEPCRLQPQGTGDRPAGLPPGKGMGMIFSLALLFICNCGGEQGSKKSVPDMPKDSTAQISQELFSDITDESGLHFTHFNGASGEYYFCEIIGSGGAFLDYDNDGDLDVFLVQGHILGENKANAEAWFPYAGDGPPRDRLFRNDLEIDGRGEAVPRFKDVTEQSGIEGTGYGMGVAVGDFDNDGWVDLYVTNLGPNKLYRNLGNGSFEDATDHSGTGDPRWGVSAAFVDVDRDGLLDLFVGNYTDFTLSGNIRCGEGEADYCHPNQYRPLPDALFHNMGNGVFKDISRSAGFMAVFGRALGVTAADFNGDGWPDLYVANDASSNQLWINRGNLTFEDTAVLAGCAFNETGLPEGSMGVDAGDFDGDGDEDLFMTHLRSETNTLYANEGMGNFSDRTVLTGLAVPSLPFTGFGTAWLDWDNDGWLDLFIANGAVTKLKGDPDLDPRFPFAQTNQLFKNRGDGGFQDVSALSGSVLALKEVSRGLASGDVDNDGDTDILVTNNSGPARLLRNETGKGHGWIGLRLVDPKLSRDMLGARVAIYRAEGPVLWRRVRSDASYASANDPRILVGLGMQRSISRILVIWPTGEREIWQGLSADRWHELRKGTGDPEPP